MMAALRSLRRLRLLVLQGNPLALVPYYRGFTIDSLAPLCVLDDITVSPNEKHQFRGLSLHGGEGSCTPAPALLGTSAFGPETPYPDRCSFFPGVGF